MPFVILILGIAGLLIGTELTIKGALAIARRYGLSEFIVGVVVLSIGSDLPELAVAIDAGIRNLVAGEASGVVVGSAVGSSVAQIGLVLGSAALLATLTLSPRYVYRHGGMLLVSTAILAWFALDGLVTRTEGCLLVGIYALYLAFLLRREDFDQDLGSALHGVRDGARAWFVAGIGLLIVGIASEVTVGSVVEIARAFNLDETMIAALVIGLGTSLPELSISIGAIVRKRVSLSVGNIVGSNIFDTLVPIGVAALIAPLAFDRSILRFDLPYLFALTAGVLALFLLRRRGLRRPEGAIVLMLYVAYVTLRLLD